MVLTIVQARMGSTRFPGKVMEDLDGKPMVRHVLERAAAITGEPEWTILAVPRGDMVEWPWPNVFRGEEDDVLQRVFDCMQIHTKIYGEKPRAVIRVTADCPLLDPGVGRLVLGQFSLRTRPYASTGRNMDGLDIEVLTMDALKLSVFGTFSPSDREHVTSWIKRSTVGTTVDLMSGKSIHWSVDTPDDLDFVRSVYRSCSECRLGTPHHTNSGTSIGGADRTLLLDLHQVDSPDNRGGLVECQAADLLHTRVSD